MQTPRLRKVIHVVLMLNTLHETLSMTRLNKPKR
jgi:hypothetical protein